MRIHKQGGYSIAEMIVYIAIFASISIVVINSFIIVARSFSVSRTNRDLLESGSTALERMSREIRKAKSIDTSNSTLGSSPGVLQLSSTDASGNATLVKFSVTSGALNLYQGGTLTGTILAPTVSVTNLIFRRITTLQGEAVKIEMTLQDTRSPLQTTAKFYDTVILRGEY